MVCSYLSQKFSLSFVNEENMNLLLVCISTWVRSAAQELSAFISFCSLEQRNLTLETEMMALHEELDQERKKFTMVEIKMRNAERAKEDAEKRNDMLQKEMEQFFSTFGELTVESRRPERGNTIWIQWELEVLTVGLWGRAWGYYTVSGGWSPAWG